MRDASLPGFADNGHSAAVPAPGVWPLRPLLRLSLFLAVIGLFQPSNILKSACLASLAVWIYGTRRRSALEGGYERLFWVPCLLGLLSLSRANATDSIRDLMFFLVPPLFFTAGREAFARDFSLTVVIREAWRVYLIVFVILVFNVFRVHGNISVQLIRDEVSPGSFLLVYYLYFEYASLTQIRFAITNVRLVVAQIVFLAQSSRTYSLVVLSFIGLSVLTRRRLGLLLGGLIAALLFLALLHGLGLPTPFATLFQRTVTELSLTDEWTAEDFGQRYRAFEMFAAVTTLQAYTALQLLVGRGFGTLIELGGFTIQLAGREYEAIPWMHNGYLYEVIKVGLLGLLCHLLAFVRLYIRIPQQLPEYRVVVRGTVIGLFLSNIVICGFFSIESAFAFFVLGYYAAQAESSDSVKRTSIR